MMNFSNRKIGGIITFPVTNRPNDRWISLDQVPTSIWRVCSFLDFKQIFFQNLLI